MYKPTNAYFSCCSAIYVLSFILSTDMFRSFLWPSSGCLTIGYKEHNTDYIKCMTKKDFCPLIWVYVLLLLDEVGDQRQSPAALPPRKRPSTHWVGPRASLERCGRSNPQEIRSLDPRASSKSLYRLFSIIILFYLCTLSVLVSLSLLYNTQHKYPCPRRVSNLKFQQTSGHRPTP